MTILTTFSENNQYIHEYTCTLKTITTSNTIVRHHRFNTHDLNATMHQSMHPNIAVNTHKPTKITIAFLVTSFAVSLLKSTASGHFKSGAAVRAV